MTTRDVDEAVSQLTEIDFYKCVQTQDALRFEVIPKPDTGLDVGTLEKKLSNLLSIRPLTVKVVRRLDPEPSLKYRLTQSTTHVPPPLA